MKKFPDLLGKTAFVTGGSDGLGKIIAKELAARGAHVTIFGCQKGPILEHARQEIMTACTMSTQEVRTVTVDLSDPSKIDEAFRSQARSPNLVYCSMLVAVDTGEFLTLEDNVSASSLVAGMSEPLSKSSVYLGDILLSFAIRWFMLPYLRQKWKCISRSEGTRQYKSTPVTWWDRLSWKLVPNF